MAYSIAPIVLTFPLGLGAVNCYLVDTGTGFVLIDTGSPNRRRELDAALARAGCRPGDLRLIVITHGDFDHIGNAAYLRARTGAPVAMHHGDTGMAQTGDMYANRGKRNGLVAWVTPRLVGFGPEDHFTPDIFLAEGNELAGHGFDARVLSIPGHSSGSIGILTTDGDLFCGDLLENRKTPALGAIMPDPAMARASVEKLRDMGVGMVYPGHGRPFAMKDLP
jgi:glyoxylase-like metal-dependent hydrolase (beta-lactamase superfamily II)